MKKHSPLHVGVIAIEKGTFRLPSTKVMNFTYFAFNQVKRIDKQTFPDYSCTLIGMKLFKIKPTDNIYALQ